MKTTASTFGKRGAKPVAPVVHTKTMTGKPTKNIPRTAAQSGRPAEKKSALKTIQKAASGWFLGKR